MARFIPVCTGNTLIIYYHHVQLTVYPCVYREHVPFHCRRTHGNGLSLCVQGTCCCSVFSTSEYRFIPVCTGNMEHFLPRQDILPVYPCVYREHSFIDYTNTGLNGLSLCVQGTLALVAINMLLLRFIPVCTGNIPIITYCFIIKILTTKFLPIF